MKVLRRPTVLVGVVLVVVGLVATALSLRDSRSERSSDGGATTPSATRPESVASAGGAGSPQDRVAQLEARVEETPDDWEALAALGAAYVAAGAVTGDPSLYPLADKSLERSLDLQPDGNLPATVAESSLAAARHDFTLAFDWAQRAEEISAEDPNVKAVLGDALVQLGRYDEAFAVFQAMIDLRPDLAAYSRISYARELQGDIDGAIVAMEAAESAAASRSDGAFAAFFLGELEWNRGNAEAAVSHYRRASELDPGAARSQAALARAAFYAGDEDEAIDGYRDVVERFPLPQYVADLADIYAVTDQPDLADDQLVLLDAQRRLFEDAGVAVDADFALINADHDLELEASLAAMETEWQIRKGIFVADALAWLLHLNGRSEDALEYSESALELGTRNALFYFHRSEINRALGNIEAAQRDLDEARAINPNFSILYSGS